MIKIQIVDDVEFDDKSDDGKRQRKDAHAVADAETIPTDTIHNKR